MTTAKTAAYRLFHYRYPVRMPQIFLYGQAYLEKHGYHISGDRALDRQRLMEPSVIHQTAAGLAMLHSEGAPIDFVNWEDAAAVYKDIQEHLRDWERLVLQGIHPANVPPLEDFRQLEAVAMAIYEIAKFYDPDESPGSALRDQLMEMNRRRNPLRTDRYLRDRISNEKGELKPYVSIVDRIERELVEHGIWQ